MDSHLDRPDAVLAYSVDGPADAAQTVIAAHSLATSRAWEDEVGILNWSPVVDAGNRLVRFDTRGHGNSSGSDGEGLYQWRSLADDYLALSDATAPHAPIIGLGSSTGCGVVLWAAVKAPERFRRLVLVIPRREAKRERGRRSFTLQRRS